ncbi:homocysteine-responsive endoplasmic reticulum-resident ubiquitin-like domain member 2 protein [Drosophila serrata]|uniref:homocysteine-responsive endoplasmic reticulum-resident ubiquitin-like domain member 2 protein n=1 Tax=Drosophila serrata TaxID=7274 RepID=UPI000A1CFC1D|nr:homocysteine-responsive endoplasmic reticulum-resident ubiquitin-like domain member 2 protein [Drosophila serrata]KAH8385398.1 hypothetical protein KR200_011376 [Drosophila serrata]
MNETANPPAAAGCDAAARQKIVATTETPETPSASSKSSVRLLIKSSNQQYDDLNVESDLGWTVKRLKKQLSLVYPGKPEIHDQKLIYSGKLLDDSQKISEVIRSYKDVYQQHHIFHLVCASKNIPKPPVKLAPPKEHTVPLQSQDNTNELRQRHAAAHQHQQQAQQAVNATVPPLANPWSQFWQHNMAAAASSGSPMAAATASANPHPHVLLQQQAILYNAWMQQVYAQYMQELALRSSVPGSSNPATPISPQPPSLLAHPLFAQLARIPNLSEAQAGVQAAPPAAAAPPAPPAEVAAAPLARPNFPHIQEEPEMRDWLDSFFSFTRLAIFVTVLYFNSSPLRCLLVVLIAGAIYLYHIGILRMRRERNNNNINRNNNAGDAAAAFAAVQQIQRMMDAAVERENNDPQAANEPGVVPPAAEGAAPAAQDVPDAATAAAPPAPATAANPDAAAVDVSAEAMAVAVEPPNANNSVISVVRTFVITFFTSLLPEAPAL